MFIEVGSKTSASSTLAAGARMILLDNMSLDQRCARRRHHQGRAELEAWRRQPRTVRAIAETGVDRISIGSLTKDDRAVDLSLRHVETAPWPGPPGPLFFSTAFPAFRP